jgi:hypothetical protein
VSPSMDSDTWITSSLHHPSKTIFNLRKHVSVQCVPLVGIFMKVHQWVV